MHKNYLVMGTLALSSCLMAGAVSSQPYPYKPVRVVTSDAGGGSDSVARVITPAFGVVLGQNIVIENHPAGVIPGKVVAKAAPDGYTLLLYSATFWTSPLFQKEPAYDAVKDFAPIALLLSAPSILVVNPALPVHSVKDLIALAKSKPGVLNYGSVAQGSPLHIAAEQFKAMAGVDIVRVTYAGSLATLTDTIAGQVQMVFAPTTAMQFIKIGKLRGLAVTTAKPSALLPDLPTIAASGLPGYAQTNASGMFAPVGTPPALIARLNKDLIAVINKPDVKDKLFSLAQEVIGGSADDLAHHMKAEIATVKKIMVDSNIKPE